MQVWKNTRKLISKRFLLKQVNQETMKRGQVGLRVYRLSRFQSCFRAFVTYFKAF